MRGRWQTLILDALNAERLVPVSWLAVDALGRPLTRAEYNALLRSAHRLAERGEIQLARVTELDARGQQNVVLLAVRPDVVLPDGLRARTLPGSYRTIAHQLGVSKSTVARMVASAQRGEE